MDDPLDNSQLAKRVDWLDNELRNDKTIIASLQSKLENTSTENSALRLRLAELESDITRLNTLMARLEQFEQDLSSIQSNLTRQIEDFKAPLQEEKVLTDKNQMAIGDLVTEVNDLRKKIKEYDNFRDELQKRQEEDIRLARLIEEVKVSVAVFDRSDDEYKRSFHMIEENRRQDVKRLTDIQGEVSAIRKRQDEGRAKQDLVGDNMRKLESRIKDLLEAESERREAQTSFIEKLNIHQVDRDRVFKQWKERFEEMEAITGGLNEEIASLEETHRSIKQSQAALDEVTQRFERRVNEITEVQRLNEDRFRQEWTTFKSDDQKRWSNYTLSQDEQHREMNRSIESLGERITSLEELLEKLSENMQQLGKEDIQRLHALLNVLRDSIENYNNIFKA